MARRGENIYKRKDGRYEGRYIKEYDENNKPVWGYIYGRTYKETKEKLAKQKISVQEKRKIQPSDITVAEWFELWLNAQRRIKKSTHRTYQTNINKHINGNLGSLKLRNLTKEKIQEFVDRLLLSLSPKSVRSVFSILKLGLDTAHEKNLIPSEIYSKIKLPKVKRKEIEVFSKREQEKIEAYVEESDNDNDLGIILCFYTGIRVGELCAIKIGEDIDLKREMLSINNTLYRVRDASGKRKTKLELSPPKSESSKRTIPLPAFLVAKLKARKSWGGFFINKNGNWVDPAVYTRRYKKILEELDIPYRSFHAIRHTFATRAIECGMDVKSLSEILGHKNPTITLNTYIHSLMEHKAEMMNRPGKLL